MTEFTYSGDPQATFEAPSNHGIITVHRSETERRHAELRGWLLCFAAIVETLGDGEFIDSGIVDQAARRIREYFNE